MDIYIYIYLMWGLKINKLTNFYDENQLIFLRIRKPIL